MSSDFLRALHPVQRLIKRTFKRHLDFTRRLFAIDLAKTSHLFPKSLKLRLNKFCLNSKCFFKILRLTQPLYEIVHSSDVLNTLILAFRQVQSRP